MKYLNKTNFVKLKNISRRYPPRELWDKIREKLAAPYQDYSKRAAEYLPSTEELSRQRKREASFAYRPLISIVVPAYETEERFLRELTDSCIDQTYPNWELCIADGSRSGNVKQCLDTFYRGEKRVRYQKLARNEGISGNTNQGFAMAKGEYLALLDHDDLLVASALYEMVKRINETGAEVLYSDEDKVDAAGKRYSDPHFKLDFNEELLLGNNYICHFLVASRRVVEQAGGLDGKYDGAQDFDFVLRLSECAGKVEHIPKILYHWRMHGGSTAGNTDSKRYAYEAGTRAVEAALERRGYRGRVQMGHELGFYRIQYEVPKGLRVTVREWGAKSPGYEKVRRQAAAELKELQAVVFWEDQADGEKPEMVCETDGEKPGTAETIEEKERRTPKVLDGEKPEPGSGQDKEQTDYLLLLNRGVIAMKPGSIGTLLGSCSRPGVSKVGSRTIAGGRRGAGSQRGNGNREKIRSRTIAGGRVKQCGYWKEGDSLVPRFAGLPGSFKGYYRRAYLPVEVDAVSNDLAVQKRRKREEEKKLIVEPSAEVMVSGTK